MSEHTDVRNPHLNVLICLGSIARHVDEYLSPGGHALDRTAIAALLSHPDVEAWMAAADKAALLPVKR